MPACSILLPAPCISQQIPYCRYRTFVASVGRLRYVGPWSSQLVASATWNLVASATWDLCRIVMYDLGRRRSTLCLNCFRHEILVAQLVASADSLRYVGPCRPSWLPLLYGTFVASVGRLRYVILIAPATWDL